MWKESEEEKIMKKQEKDLYMKIDKITKGGGSYEKI